MQLSFERSAEKGREKLSLPAYYYNSLHLLFACQKGDALFIPIRSLQFLAVVDKEEVVFIDAARKRFVDVAWENFSPQQRISLADPVPYEQVTFVTSEFSFHDRLPGEFIKAVNVYREKHMPKQECDAKVIQIFNADRLD